VTSTEPSDLERLEAELDRRGSVLAVAESLTGGALASALARRPGAREWFRGGTVAYQLAVKQRLLGVTEGVDPCSAECAVQLADGAAALFSADVGISVTGVGGPDAEDGHPAGTVFVGARVDGRTHWRQHAFRGEPAEVVERSVAAAVALAVSELCGSPAPQR
jgi:nicotinamide-nucleotide amidase